MWLDKPKMWLVKSRMWLVKPKMWLDKSRINLLSLLQRFSTSTGALLSMSSATPFYVFRNIPLAIMPSVYFLSDSRVLCPINRALQFYLCLQHHLSLSTAPPLSVYYLSESPVYVCPLCIISSVTSLYIVCPLSNISSVWPRCVLCGRQPLSFTMASLTDPSVLYNDVTHWPCYPLLWRHSLTVLSFTMSSLTDSSIFYYGVTHWSLYPMLWRHSLIPLSYAMASLSDPSILYYSVTHRPLYRLLWRHSLTLYYGVTHWLFTMASLTDASILYRHFVGTVKIVYPDGRQETKYAHGRVRVKDHNGTVILDTASLAPPLNK